MIPPVRQIALALVALYVAYKTGHPEVLGAWGWHPPHRSHGGGHVRRRPVRHVAAHPSHRAPRSASYGHTYSSRGHTTRGTRVPGGVNRYTRRGATQARHGYHGIATTTRQRAYLTALTRVLAEKGYSRKVARAVFVALATKGSGLNRYLRHPSARGLKAVGKFAKRAKQLEGKYGHPVGLAAAVGGNAPIASYSHWYPAARAELHANAAYWAKKLPQAYRYTGGKYSGQKALFAKVGGRYGIDPKVLWSIYRVETAYGTNKNTSSAGAQGPMQFMPATWAQYGRGKSIHSLPAAVDAAARYLKAAGAPRDYRRAVLAYNHAGWYADDVLSRSGLAAFGKGGGGKKVKAKRSGGPYKQIRQFYRPKPRSSVPGGVPSAAGVAGSSSAAGAGSGARSVSVPASTATIGAAATQLAATLLQQSQQITPTAPAAPAANAQVSLPFPASFTQLGQGLQAPAFNPLRPSGLTRRRPLSAYLGGR